VSALRGSAGEGSTAVRGPSGLECALASAALVILTLLVAGPLMGGGWYLSHEGIAPIERVVAVAHEVEHGDPYPRWVSSATFGQGSPFLNFYSPALYLAAGYLHALGLGATTALALLLVVCLAAGAAGAGVWAGRGSGAASGFLASALYLVAPYHLVDLYVRGALAEFAALAILPFVFLGIDLLVEEPERMVGFLVIAASSAALVSTHNLSAFMAAPLAATYGALRLGVRGWSCRTVSRLIGAAAVGAALSAFYWMPAVAESSHLRQLNVVWTGPYDPRLHFLEPEQWLDSGWGYGFSVSGTGDGMSFQLGAGLLAAAAVALVSMATGGRRHAARFGVLAALAALSLGLTARLAAPLYQALPALAWVQFPWRFLGPASLFLAALGGLAAARGTPAVRWSIAVMLAMIAVVAGGRHREPAGTIDGRIVAAVEASPRSRAMGTMTIANEYLPRWVPSSQPWRSPTLDPWVASGTGRVTGAVRRGNRVEFDVDSRGAVAVDVPAYYFPGWKASANGKPVRVGPGPAGFVRIDLPPGHSAVVLEFGTTAVRVAAWAITFGSVGATVFFLAARRLRFRRNGGAAPTDDPVSSGGRS